MSFAEHLAESAEPVRDAVRASLENGVPLRIVGGRSWLDAGRPVTAADELVLTLSGTVEYVPGDLTITTYAGTSLREIANVTGEHGQWLALDPFGSPAATIGATVATASGGPLAHAFGTPRDQVIGLGFVTGRGDYVRSGGRVVKNVAGFDLTRLMIGAWGTLGAVTDVTLRLRSRPEVDSTIALVLSDDMVRFRRTLDEIAEAQLSPLAMELVNPAMARALGLDGDTLFLIRLGGNRALVSAQQETFARMGEIRHLDTGTWEQLRRIEPAGSAVARFSGPLTGLAAIWHAVQRATESTSGLMHATPARGVVRCIVPAPAADLLLGIEDETVSRVFERLPAEQWAKLPAAAVNDRLSRRVREAFDPALLLNPGILGQQIQ